MHKLVRVVGRFASAVDGTPIGGPAYRARLFDKDPLSDDLLSEAVPAPDGSVGFTFDLSEASSADSPGEVAPDLYVVLLRDGQPAFRSDVIPNVSFFGRHPVTGMEIEFTHDLGVLRVG